MKNKSSEIQVTIVLPVYNEGKNIKKVLQEFARQVDVDFYLVLVYDSEEDNTIPAVRKIKKSLPFSVNLLKNKYGSGALNAIKTGIENAKTEFVIISMADLSDSPDTINMMYKFAQDKNADIVCASRYSSGGQQIGGPFLKSLMSKTAAKILYYFAALPTLDPTNNFKLYRRKIFDEISIESKGGFELALEIVVKAREKNFVILDIPSVWRDREAGKSNFQLKKWLPSYLFWFFRAFKNKKAIIRCLKILAFVLLFSLTIFFYLTF